MRRLAKPPSSAPGPVRPQVDGGRTPPGPMQVLRRAPSRVTRSIRPTGNPTAMAADDHQTNPPTPEFDFSSYPQNTMFHERREGRERGHRGDAGQPATPSGNTADPERRQKKERRRRIDP